MRFILLIVITGLFLCAEIYAQYDKAYKRQFNDAEYYLWTENYAEALEIYKALLEIAPENNNLHYLIGTCYMNLPGQKQFAEEHFKIAIFHITPNYKYGSYKEENAPPEAIFELAKVSQANHQFDDAIKYYLEYRNQMINPDYADLEFVNKQIESCERAKILVLDVQPVEMTNIASQIGAADPNYQPVFAKEDSTLIYMCDHPRKRTIYMTRLSNGQWSQPEVIDDQIGSYGDCSVSFITSDGKTLYVARLNEFDSDIYVSHFEDGHWTKIIKLNKNVNTIYYESQASVSPDGNILFFTSNRKGGHGALDIYICELDDKDRWGPAQNVGPVINTPYNEESPFLSADNKTLYFSSQGHETMGGYDVFYATMNDDKSFSTPQNMGYPISTADDDLHFIPADPVISMFMTAFAGEGDADINMYQVQYVNEQELKAKAQRIAEKEQDETVAPLADQTITETEPVLPETGGRKSLVIKNILFDYNTSILNEKARQDADQLYLAMSEFPDLTIEVIGHTDSKGSADFNMKLSEQRARSIKNYLVGKGIEANRFVVRGAGETANIAINNNPDGSDNKEGRRLNRHVEIRLVNFEGDHISVEEIVVPDHLRPRTDLEFSVVLLENITKRDDLPGMIQNQKVEEYRTGDVYLYLAGHFRQRSEAVELLNHVIDNGFSDGRIIEKGELSRIMADAGRTGTTQTKIYTIQIMSLKNAVDVSFFKNVAEVKKYDCKDGLTRYVIGEYYGIQEALNALPEVKENGYQDAFIMNVEHYKKLAR